MDPEIAWEELGPRPKRAAERRAQTERHVEGQPRGARQPAMKRQASHESTAQPKRAQGGVPQQTPAQPVKRSHGQAQHSDSEHATDQKRLHRAPEKRPLSHQPVQNIPSADQITERRGITRTAEPSVGEHCKRTKSRGVARAAQQGSSTLSSKHLHRRAPRRLSQHQLIFASKRKHPLLQRAAKRAWQSDDHDQTQLEAEHKKLRLELIDFVVDYMINFPK